MDVLQPNPSNAAARIETIRKLASRQHGVVARGQLLDAGFSTRSIDHQVSIGKLIPLHRGVYAVGHVALSRRGHEMAGVLACDLRTAVISHFSAAVMWGMLTDAQVRRDQKDHRLHVSFTQGRNRPPRIRTHHVKPIFPKDRRTIDGVPVTSPARTLLDIASDPKTKLLGPAVNEGRIKRDISNDSIQEVIDRYPNMAGIQALEAQLVDASYSRSKAEVLMKKLLETHDLPPAKQNQPLLGHEVDFIWPEHDLILEVNGFVFHSSRHKFDKDNSKIADLRLAGYDVIEVGWPQITKEPDLVARLIRDGLNRSENRGLKKS